MTRRGHDRCRVKMRVQMTAPSLWSWRASVRINRRRKAWDGGLAYSKGEATAAALAAITEMKAWLGDRV